MSDFSEINDDLYETIFNQKNKLNSLLFDDNIFLFCQLQGLDPWTAGELSRMIKEADRAGSEPGKISQAQIEAIFQRMRSYLKVPVVGAASAVASILGISAYAYKRISVYVYKRAE